MDRLTPGLLALAFAFAAPAAADEWNKTYPMTGRPEVSINAGDATVRVHHWDRKAVEAKVVTSGWKISPNQVRIEEEQTGDRLDLRVREPQMHWGIGMHQHRIEIDVTVPQDLDLTVRTGDGAITLPPLTGKISAHTGDGSIRAERLKGEIQLGSGDGSIVATQLDGRLEARNGDGMLRVDGRFDLIQMSSGDGSITLTVLEGSRLAGDWEISTGDGPVELRVPRDLKANLDVRCGDGHIDIDLPVTVSGRLDRSSVQGRMNGGGPVLRLRTGDGSIRIGTL